MKTALAVFAALGTIFLTLPIWFFLLYKILQAVNASDLMWFLYWIYAPASLFIHAAFGVVKAIGEDK
jgi:hypothetical protein